MMIPVIHTRSGDDERALADDYVRSRKEKLNICDLQNPDDLIEENVLAVHFADGGAQGDAGAVEILYSLPDEVKILYGNYCYGNLNLDAVIRKLPLLKSLDSRYASEFPYPFGGRIVIPEGWRYLYMGALNHLFVRQEIAEKTSVYLKTVIEKTGSWEAFRAIAWFCGA